MNILLIDHDPVQSQLMIAKMTGLGHDVVHHTAKQSAIEALSATAFDVIMCDPSPMRDATPILMDIKRYEQSAAYIVLLQNEDNDFSKSGQYNCLMDKPVSSQALEKMLDNAEQFQALYDHMIDNSVDFPNAGGVISKSAFCQLFLSAIDRSGRYKEQNSLIIITIENLEDIIDLDGDYAGTYAAAQLSKFLVQIRRQSDIIGQIGESQFALLLQRPSHEKEPFDAANRFAHALQDYDLIGEKNVGPVAVSLSLISLPSGNNELTKSIHYDRKNT